jgi:hypothetical protein
VNLGWGPSALDLNEAPERYERPDTLEQEEAPLLFLPCEHGEDGRPDEVEDEVGARTLVPNAELSRRIGGEDEHRSDYLNHLGHGSQRTAAETGETLAGDGRERRQASYN